MEEKLTGGNFIDREGTVLGTHKGYPFYTIGQRKGLEIALGEPMFVTEIVPQTNTVVLGTIDDLQKQETFVRNINLIKYALLKNETEAVTKIRYKDVGTSSTLTQDGDRVHVKFHHKVKGIAPGQSAVFYEGDDVIGGGFIDISEATNS